MQITIMTQGNHAPVALEGGTLIIGDYAIDIPARQSDVEVTIDLSLCDKGCVVEGQGAGWYVANVMLPPARLVEVKTGENDPETGEPVTTLERAPVDYHLIRINLWALPAAPATEGE
ncbi:hypothetical protein [Geoalkalibacter subterraneus]|uniref:Uncharacterized protein n=1 Tax=Geoalkalibacter subterraneus TaxID=483547 RepID=A0A0B5FSX1_9BACT|nr:hypothetical protein [Geoalkalibacter subterraneus]AJF07754.1 hypothetical protein GSUB_15985 [Geoalkalibacter subterraneus]